MTRITLQQDVPPLQQQPSLVGACLKLGKVLNVKTHTPFHQSQLQEIRNLLCDTDFMLQEFWAVKWRLCVKIPVALNLKHLGLLLCFTVIRTIRTNVIEQAAGSGWCKHFMPVKV